MDDYIQDSIGMLDRGHISVSNLTNKICIKLRDKLGREVTDAERKEIENYLTKYHNNEISSEELSSFLKNKMTKQNNYHASPPRNDEYNNDNNANKEPVVQEANIPVTEEDVVDVEVNAVMEVSEQYAEIESEVSNTNITIPGNIAPYAENLTNIINSSVADMEEGFTSAKAALLDILRSVEDLDKEIAAGNYDEFDFNKIWLMAYNKKTGSDLKEADASFFMQNENCTVNGNKVTFVKDGKTYQYDMSTKVLSVNGDSMKVGFFVPKNGEYSKMNTFTYFIANDWDQPTTYQSNAIMIRVLKGDVGGQKFNKQKMVPEATRFMNGVANTDLVNCQNIVGGDSLYGAESLKLAANNGDLYQTIYCVNNAVLVKGINATKGDKVSFDDLNELKGLNGKNIYFISATGDENFNHCAKNGGGWVDCSYNEGYVFSGIELTANNCPDANIYLIYNANGKGTKSPIVNHYREADKNHSNVTYLEDKWFSFARKDYNYHTEGNRIMQELYASDVVNYNGYTS